MCIEVENDGERLHLKTNPKVEHRGQRTNKQPYRDVRRW